MDSIFAPHILRYPLAHIPRPHNLDTKFQISLHRYCTENEEGEKILSFTSIRVLQTTGWNSEKSYVQLTGTGGDLDWDLVVK